MNYAETSFKELREELKSRGLKAGGSRDALVDRLTNDDLGHAPTKKDLPAAEQATDGLKATDPNPNNPNYDMAGRWIRRTGKAVGPTGLSPKPGNRW